MTWRRQQDRVRKNKRRRNPAAKALSDPTFRPKAVGSPKNYDRSRAKREAIQEVEEFDDDDEIPLDN